VRITDGASPFAAPEKELEKIQLLMHSHAKLVRETLAARLRGYRPHQQTLKALEVVSWLDPEDARPLRSAVRGCQATNNAAVKKLAGEVLAGMDRR
jgi:hypothetical protein